MRPGSAGRRRKGFVRIPLSFGEPPGRVDSYREAFGSQFNWISAQPEIGPAAGR
jgi:hypothetical protein